MSERFCRNCGNEKETGQFCDCYYVPFGGKYYCTACGSELTKGRCQPCDSAYYRDNPPEPEPEPDGEILDLDVPDWRTCGHEDTRELKPMAMRECNHCYEVVDEQGRVWVLAEHSSGEVAE